MKRQIEVEGVIDKVVKEKGDEDEKITHTTHIEFTDKDGKYCGFAVVYQELGRIDEPVKLTIKK